MVRGTLNRCVSVGSKENGKLSLPHGNKFCEVQFAKYSAVKIILVAETLSGKPASFCRLRSSGLRRRVF